jgi:hypothetical protein
LPLDCVIVTVYAGSIDIVHSLPFYKVYQGVYKAARPMKENNLVTNQPNQGTMKISIRHSQSVKLIFKPPGCHEGISVLRWSVQFPA